MAETKSIVGPELQSLPLPLIVSAAMNGIVSAQAISANTTSEFLKSMNEQVNFDARMTGNDNQSKEVTVSVPKLAVVPIPSIRVDSATIHFNFEVKQVLVETSSNEKNANLNVGTKGLLRNLLSADLSGSISHKNASENTLNRSGLLDITIHLSEPAIPEGLSRVLGILNNAITVTDKPTGNNP